jgi:hypothetical protein
LFNFVQIFATYFDINGLSCFMRNIQTNFEIDYFTGIIKRCLLCYAIHSTIFIVSMLLLCLVNPELVHASYKKIILSFFIATLVFLFQQIKKRWFTWYLHFTFIYPSNISYWNAASKKLNQNFLFTCCL